jgi:amino acid transporter
MADDEGDDRRDPDRELGELTAELRVILPGTTVLFAFLLTLPFSVRFDQLTPATRSAFFVAFITTGMAIVLLLGESSYHRMQPQSYNKEAMIRTASHQTVAASALLGVALTAVVFLVINVVYGLPWGIGFAAGLFMLATVTWFVLPLVRRNIAKGS